MAERAYITPKVLKWARESARMSLDTAAAKIPIKKEKLIEWEDGTNQPTIRQAEILAKAYRRPFSIFFLPEIPNDFQPLQDFRRETSVALGTAATFIIREIQQKQAWISDLFEENDEEVLAFVGKYSLKDNPITVANDILSTLQIDPSNYVHGNPIKEWVLKAEANGIFISRTSFIHSRLTIDSEEIQGFSIANKYAPFVFINSHDWNAPQLFTLVHELAHIWIAASGISNEIGPGIGPQDKFHPVELFCNEVAANSLMPIGFMSSLSGNTFESSKGLFRIAKRIGVSSFAFLYRSYKLRLISLKKYQDLKTEAEEDFKEFLKKEEKKKAQQKERKGGPDYYQLLVNKNGHLFTRIVMDAFRGGTIAPTQASNLLNTQLNNFSRLESFLGK